MIKFYDSMIIACFALLMYVNLVHAQIDELMTMEQLEQDASQLIESENQRVALSSSLENDQEKIVDQLIDSTINLASFQPVDYRKLADQAICQGYFSPQEQYAVLALFDRPLALDRNTGLTPNLPTVSEILDRVDFLQQKTIAINDLAVRKLAQERIKKAVTQALQVTLQAIDIAIFAQSLQAAYQDRVSLTSPKIDKQLYDQLLVYKKKVKQVFDSQTKIESWKDYVSGYFATVNSLPDGLQQIFADNSYRQVKNDISGVFAANLLFKQILITHQYIQSQFSSFLQQYAVQLQLHTDLNFYRSVPDLDRFVLIFKNAATAIGHNPDKIHELHQLHQVIIAVRKAVQVALFVANKNASMNVAGLLPASMIAIFDRITKQLLKYDQQLDLMCKDQRFGATQGDFYRDKVWSAISSLASGVALAGVGTAMWYDVGGMRSEVVGDGALAVIQDLMSNPLSVSVKKYSNAAIRKGLQWYELSHTQAVPGQSFIEPETWQAAQAVTNYATRDIAPMVHSALTAKGEWTDPVAEREFKKVHEDLSSIVGTGIKEGVKQEVAKVITAPLNPFIAAKDKLVNYFGYDSSLSEPVALAS